MSQSSDTQGIQVSLEDAPHTPKDFALVFAVPTCRSEFERGARGPGRDFVPRLMEASPGRGAEAIWSEYAPIAHYARALIAEAKGLGCLTQTDSTFASWCDSLQRRPVVVLFAHCRQGQPDEVEFADGMHEVAEVAQAVPPTFSGVLDFTVCYSLQLAPLIKRRSPHTQLILNKHETAVTERLAILSQVLRLTAAGKISYPQAVTEVRLALLRGRRS